MSTRRFPTDYGVHAGPKTSLPRITLTTAEVGQVYGLSATFLQRHPEIPRVKAGHRTTIYRIADIERFLAEREVA